MKDKTISRRDIMTILLLLAGGILLPAAGWIIGVSLLWTSGTWRLRDKLIGTFVVPGGLMAAAVVGGMRFPSQVRGNGTVQTALTLSLAIGAVFSAVWLYLAARRIPKA